MGSKSVNEWDPWVDIASKESKRSHTSIIVESWEYTSKESSMVEECKGGKVLMLKIFKEALRISAKKKGGATETNGINYGKW